MAEITGKMMLIDSSVCMGCRSCQVACKQWHHLPGEPVENLQFGHYENPKDLSGITFTRVRYIEHSNVLFRDSGRAASKYMQWLFFKDQCRHCVEPACKKGCPVSGAVVIKPSGAVVFTDACDPDKCRKRPCEKECEYKNIPHLNVELNKEKKCDLCFDRFDHADLRPEEQIPICAKTCPSGALKFGDVAYIQNLGYQRLAELRSQYRSVKIYPEDDMSKTHVVWMLIGEYGIYKESEEHRDSHHEEEDD